MSGSLRLESVRPERSRRRTVTVAAAVILVLVLAVAAVVVSTGNGHDSPRAPHTATFGLLAATPSQLGTLSPKDGVSDVEVAANWDVLEPQRDEFDGSRLAALRASVLELSGRGFHVVLDLGLQYPPAWVFALPGPNRFVDQYGDVWQGTGVASSDVPNAVFDPAVRTAEAVYIARLGRALHGTDVSRVRVGGLLSGELRYPPAVDNTHSDAIWMYDSGAQSRAPVPGWRPGSGSLGDAYRSLRFYFGALTGYLTWQMHRVVSAFPAATQEILFPSFGLRPGMLDQAVRSGLTGQTTGERGGLISSGLDWRQQVSAVAHTGIPAILSSTWLDGPSEGDTLDELPPIGYLAHLGKRFDLPVSGENTGGGGTSALLTCLERVSQYRLHDMMFMGGELIASGQAGVSFGRFTAVIRAFVAGP